VELSRAAAGIPVKRDGVTAALEHLAASSSPVP
jgi:hypothetical protein